MFLEQVQKICAQKGIAIAQLEADIGISRGSVYKWRKHSPSLDVACNVSNYLGVSLDELVGQDFYPSDKHIKKESSTSTPLSGDIFFERFEGLLKEKGLRAADVSKATGITPSTFTDWKKGRYVPKIDKILLIANYFGVSLDYLMGNDISSDSDSFYTTPEEQAIISAYRACDEMGKGMVRRILNIPDDAYNIAAEVARKELEDTPAKNEELTKKDI